MATYSDAGHSRKRIATYGKVIRKHLQGHIAFNNFPDLDSAKADPRASHASSVAEGSFRRNASCSPSSTASAITNMFDVPSSDDDEMITTPPKRRKLSHPSENLKADLTKNSLYPHHSLSQQHTLNVAAKSSKRTAAKHGNEQQQISSRSPAQDSAFAISSVLTSRPSISFKKAGTPSDTIIARTPTDRVMEASKHCQRKLTDPEVEDRGSTNAPFLTKSYLQRSPSPTHQDLSGTASKCCTSSPNSLSQMDVGCGSTPFRTTQAVLTPKGMKMWQGLLGEDGDGVLHLTRFPPVAEPTHICGVECRNKDCNGRLPRRRLIDSLVKESHEYKPILGLECESNIENANGWTLATDHEELEDQRLATMQISHIPLGSASSNGIGVIANGGQVSQASVTKFTYSRQRSILAEQDVTKELGLDVPLIEIMSDRTSQKQRGSVPVIVPIQHLYKKSEAEDANAGVAIRTIHELRQAGAQTRFKDEVEDLFDRIGSPTQQKSVRRSGLMDLAGKMKDKTFLSDFLSNGMDHDLLLHLGQEQDVISGFILLSLLMTMLDSGMTIATVSHLHRHGIFQLLVKLIDIKDSILTIAKDRKTNMSKSAQILLSEIHQSLLGLKLWNGLQPHPISPRTASLQCLELMARQCREAGDAEDFLSKELMSKLFMIVRLSSNGTSEGVNAIDNRLALNILESYSFHPIMITEEYLPTMRDLLKGNLETNSDNATIALLLRIVLNITNNSSSASEVFASLEILHLMCRAVIKKFKMLSESILELERLVVVDQLVLMLVVMINILELSIYAVACFDRFHDYTVDDLVQIFLENNENAYKADSVEDSHLNVASGYLAVLLGYLSLSAGSAGPLAVCQQPNTIQALITCIDEFIGHHRKVDDLFKDNVDHNPQAGLTDKLQSLIIKLKKKTMT